MSIENSEKIPGHLEASVSALNETRAVLEGELDNWTGNQEDRAKLVNGIQAINMLLKDRK